MILNEFIEALSIAIAFGSAGYVGVMVMDGDEPNAFESIIAVMVIAFILLYLIISL